MTKQKKSILTCNMCHTQMRGSLVFKNENAANQLVAFCTNPRCPNYALLQIAAEQMPEAK